MDQEIIARGARAKQILDMPEFKELLEQVKRDTFDEWATTAEIDTQRLAELKSTMTGLNRFYGKIVTYIRDAAVEQHNAANIADT
jgi:hypothetical protein